MKYVLIALKGELPEHNLDPEQFKVWYHGVGKKCYVCYYGLYTKRLRSSN